MTFQLFTNHGAPCMAFGPTHAASRWWPTSAEVKAIGIPTGVALQRPERISMIAVLPEHLCILLCNSYSVSKTLICDVISDWRYHPYHHSTCEEGLFSFVLALYLLTLRTTAILGRGIQRASSNALFTVFSREEIPTLLAINRLGLPHIAALISEVATLNRKKDR